MPSFIRTGSWPYLQAARVASEDKASGKDAVAEHVVTGGLDLQYSGQSAQHEETPLGKRPVYLGSRLGCDSVTVSVACCQLSVFLVMGR